MIIATMALAFAACQKVENGATVDTALVKIDPVITRATSTNFEDGDRIGLAIIKDGSEFASNACLSYSEESQSFTGDQKWYADGGESCSLKAFYPYQDAGFPTSFTVASDQSTGAGAYDFMVAAKDQVYPQNNPVSMVFKHYLSQIVINVDNVAGAEIESVVLKNFIPTANITIAEGAIEVAAADVEKVDIKAEALTANTKYRAVVVPQTIVFALEIAIKEGAVLVSNVPESILKSGYTYNVNVVVTADNVKASISGEIANWEDGGDLDGGAIEKKVLVENLEEGYITYHDQKYNVVKMKDGKWWMAQNMRYVPKGKSVSSTPSDGSGLWYPATNATKTPMTDDASVEALGLLYDAATAFGVEAITVDNAETLEGCQGICPEGWHIPTNAELTGLVGHNSNSAMANTEAPYYDAAVKGAYIPTLNEDGFNWTFVGAVNRASSSATGAYLVTNYGEIYGAMSYVLGSTCYQVSKNTDDSIKNVQYYSFMSTFNASNNKVTVAFGNFLSGLSVRCVRD